MFCFFCFSFRNLAREKSLPLTYVVASQSNPITLPLKAEQNYQSKLKANQSVLKKKGLASKYCLKKTKILVDS